MSDPFKEMVRKYDASVVSRGGASLFDLQRQALIRPQSARQSRSAMSLDDLRRIREVRKGIEAKKAREQAKPGRILGGAIGKLGGFASDWDV